MNLNRQCENLIIELRKGRKSALAGIYNLIGRQMYVVAYNVLCDHQLTEDSVQESLITISEKAETLTDTEAAKSWIMTIVRNKSLDILRERKKEVYTEDFTVYETGFREPDATEKFIDIDSALKKLREDDRQIVLMKAAMGFSHKDIAGILNISVDACRKKYQRSLIALRSYLK